jgi:hypothetical protein
MRKIGSGLLVLSAVVLVALGFAGAGGSAATGEAQYLVVAKSGADLAGARADVARAGGKVTSTLGQLNTLIVTATGDFKSRMSRTHAKAVGRDHIVSLINPSAGGDSGTFNPNPSRTKVNIASAPNAANLMFDPSFGYPGLMWSIQRIHGPLVQNPVGPSNQITVGVADTGLDYTHVDLANKVKSVVDFTSLEDPPVCSTFFGESDADLAALFGAPSDDLDFNGHGSWIGGNIAGDLNKTGVNGIAPKVNLVALKIAQWCGSTFDSTILAAFLYAADAHINVVSISFGGYLDRSNPDEDLIYQLYLQAVSYANAHGTTIVASAGNEHVRVGAGGQVLSHGELTAPPGGDDLFGLWENPGGVPGVIDVSSTGNVVNAPSATCPADSLASGGFDWCKPTSDAHQSAGIGQPNQLAYYSDYGPRIDLAGPGGARKFNLPVWDRGGTPGWPYTGIDSLFGGTSVSDGYNAWEDFSTTSNWATEIPCFVFGVNVPPQSGFDPNNCYSIIQGTSMAAPHVSASLALALAYNPLLRAHPLQAVAQLKRNATKATNYTQGLSLTDTTPGDQSGAACPNGYCHLGGPAIPSSEAYGAGVVDAARGVTSGS